jgi:hypothetical protein
MGEVCRRYFPSRSRTGGEKITAVPGHASKPEDVETLYTKIGGEGVWMA